MRELIPVVQDFRALMYKGRSNVAEVELPRCEGFGVPEEVAEEVDAG